MIPQLPVKPTLGSSLQASKWQKIPVLLDSDEMYALFQALGEFWIVQVSGLIANGQEIISQKMFLELYHRYMTALKVGETFQDARLRAYFSSVLTVDLEALYAVQVNAEQRLVKVERPVIQMQAHRFDYSLADQTFRSMVMGVDSIQWGLQFAYPHLYQDAQLQVITIRENEQFPNTALFKRLQKWMREHTIATPFEVKGKRTNVPIRLGKHCLSWINTHPQFAAKGLSVSI